LPFPFEGLDALAEAIGGMTPEGSQDRVVWAMVAHLV